MFAFIALLFTLIVIYILTIPRQQKEGFDPINREPSHKVNIPVNIIPPAISPPPVRSVNDKEVKPSELPGTLPVAPYEQIAHASPLPYQDPTLIKANREQILKVLDDLKGFLAFQAQEISQMSDPAIQLPLTTSRADFKRLQDEAYFLQRNPGIQPEITMEYLNEIYANLGYLQRKVLLIGTAGPLQGPIYEFTQPVNVTGGKLLEGFQSGAIATPDELEAFVSRISAEIIRLSASGTTDPVINARVVALTQMKQSVQTILDQIKSGALMSTEIPILKSDIDKAFPILGKPSEPLPQIIQSLKLPAGLGNLLPSNLQNDPNTNREISKLIDKYGDQVVNGVSASASFTVKYMSPREADIAKVEQSAVANTGFPSITELSNISNQGHFQPTDQGQVTDQYAQKPGDAGRGPGKFDWKTRAFQIVDQIKKRKLNPSDFGIIPDGTRVSDDFSWQGYARMICTRLQATMDPALPETCGCPPMNWKGWHVADY